MPESQSAREAGRRSIAPVRSFLDEMSLLDCCSLKDLRPVGWKAIARIVIVVL